MEEKKRYNNIIINNVLLIFREMFKHYIIFKHNFKNILFLKKLLIGSIYEVGYLCGSGS